MTKKTQTLASLGVHTSPNWPEGRPKCTAKPHQLHLDEREMGTASSSSKGSQLTGVVYIASGTVKYGDISLCSCSFC